MIGKTILHYEILEQIGEGGMGTVYKAKDTKLDRFVALKFLPSQLATTEEEKARFIQEAKAASAINHPNICTIYDIQEDEGKLFIVMEYIDGVTLREKKENLSEKRILDIGVQAAEGLAAAHEKGIVHRDIKPENIMIRKDGIVQIMDFGLAKLYTDSNVSRLTKAGTTMGTMGYMSPEQVQGLDVDHRSDIFSLGVVMYELFAGESPFKGMHETAIMYEIVNVEAPPIATVKADIDPLLDGLILECLEKDKDERCQSAKELAKNLRKIKRVSTGNRTSRMYNAKSLAKEPTYTESTPDNFYSKLMYHISRNKISTTIISLLLFSVIILVLLAIQKSPDSNFTEPVRFSFDIPGKSNPLFYWESMLQISPDGRSIVYTDKSTSSSIIKIRKINNMIINPIRGTEGGGYPIFENKNWLSFKRNDFIIRIPLTGGVPENSKLSFGNGISWGTNGEIVSNIGWSKGLFIQNNLQSNQERLTKIDIAKNEGAHLYPFILPNNKAALFTVWSKDGTFDDAKIGLVNLETKEKKYLNYNNVDLQGTFPQFIKAPWGDYILWSRSGNLYASLFDLSDLTVTGPEIEILTGISVNSQSGNAAYSVSNANNGTIAFIPGKLDTAKNYLVWIDKKGNEKKVISRSGPYIIPSVSNDGRALVILASSVYKIGLINFKDDKVDLIFSAGDNTNPRITPDGKSFVFVSNFKNGKYNVYLSRMDGIGGTKEIVTTEEGLPEISNLSPDGSKILYIPTYGIYKYKILIKDIKSELPPKLLFKTEANIKNPSFSPDGKFIAYISDEIGGKFKVFIRPFPINNSKLQISRDEGLYPQWSIDGTEIYYRTYDKIFANRIQKKPKLKVLSKRLVYNSLPVSYVNNQQDFAVAPGGRILLLKSAVDKSNPIKVNVILNWFTEIKKKLKNEN
ncbi:MAG: serine/threonine-protein kinase [Bacteroidetes bacterium]|nr:serine/threonine-protein kinase [Bacteroidota bacterium]